MTTDQVRRKTFRLRFSVRQLVLLITGLAILFAVIGRMFIQRNATLKAINTNGGIATGRSGDNDWVFGGGLDPLRRIKRVELSTMRSATAALPYVRGLPEFEELKIVDVLLRDEDLRHLTENRRLRVLSVWCPRMSDGGLAHIGDLNKLTYLDISGTDITDEGMRHLSRLNELEHLDLDYTSVGDTGIARLLPLAKLRHISLRGTQVTSDGARSLCQFRELESVDISETSVCDDAVDELTTLEKLSWLDIDGTQISANGRQKLWEFSANLGGRGLSAPETP